MEKTNKKLNFLEFAGVTFIMLIFLISAIFLWDVDRRNPYIPKNCEGIENWFTNTSFEDDVCEMEKVYYERYDTENEFLFRDLRPPKDLNGTGTYDCQDFSMNLMCLSKLYNEDCFYYWQFEPSERNPLGLNERHQGVKCVINGKERIIS